MPTMPQNAAGIRIVQPKSVPCASGSIPAATATAEPPEEPAGLNSGFQGLRVAPNNSLTVLAPVANSGVLVLASTIAPAALRRRTTSASSAGTLSSNSGEPNVVRMPAVTVTSLMPIGSPCSGPSAAPCITASSAARAATRAWSTASVTMALSFGFFRLISARCASSTSTGLTVRDLISEASSRAGFRVRVSSAICLLAGPVNEIPLDQQEEQVQAVTEGACGKDRRVHVGHVEQLLRLEHPMPKAVGRADEHFGDDDDDERERHAVAQP